MTERAAFFTFSLVLALATGAMITSSAIDQMRKLEAKRAVEMAVQRTGAAPMNADSPPAFIVAPSPPIIIYSPQTSPWTVETKPEGKNNGHAR